MILYTARLNLSGFRLGSLVGAKGAHVHFDLNIAPGELLRLSGAAPALIEYQRVTGYVRSDGQMYDRPAVSAAPFDITDPGQLGVRLIANDPDLNLDPGISYHVSLEQVSEGRTRVYKSFNTPIAPSTDTVVDLALSAPGPGVTVETAPSPGLGYASNILDSTTLGRGLVTAADPSVARTLLGIDLIDLDEFEWFDTLADFPAMGSGLVVYGARDTNSMYRWTGSAYVKVSGQSNVAAVDIVDSTTVGRQLLTAADAAAVRSAAGATATGSSLVTAASAKAARTAIGALSSGVRLYATEFGVNKNGSGVPSNNVANLYDALDTLWQAGGGELILPAGVIDTSDAVIGTVTADSGRTFTNTGDFIVPDKTNAGVQIEGWTVTGAGKGATVIKLSSGFPYLWHFKCLFDGVVRKFKGITLRGFTVDRNNLCGGVTYGPETTINFQEWDPQDWVYQRVTPQAGGSFSADQWQNVRTVYFPPDNAGTTKGTYANARWDPGLGLTVNHIQLGMPYKLNAQTGDKIRGVLLGAVLIGNSYRGLASSNNKVCAKDHIVEDVLIQDIDIINAGSTPPTSERGWDAVQNNYVCGIQFTSEGSTPNRYITNVRVERFRMWGGDVGINIAGYQWMDELHLVDCFHDTLLEPTPNMGGQSVNFQFAGGPIGTASMTRCVGRRSADTGIEVDNVWRFSARDCVVEEAWNGIFNNNDVPPANSAAGAPTATLAASMANSSAQTTASFTLPATVARQGLARIDSELVWYRASNAAATTFDIWRGVNGSTVASHAANAKITFIEYQKTQFVYDHCTINNRAITTLTPGQTGVGFLAKGGTIPLAPAVFRNCTVNQSGGDLYDATKYWGAFISWDGWRPATVIEGCRFNADGITNTSAKTGGGIAWNNSGLAASYNAGIPVPPSRITGRSNMMRVSGTTTNASSKFKALRGRAGYVYTDLDIAAEVNLTGATVGNVTLADLNPTTGPLIVAAGSRLGIKPINTASMAAESSPLALAVGSTSLTTILDQLQLDISAADLAATGTAIDATQTSKVTIGSSSVGSIRYAPAKGSPADADEIGLLDSAASFQLAKLTFGTIKSAVLAALGAVAVAPLQTINTQTASYTLAAGDASNIVSMNSSSALTLTVPTNSAVACPVGTRIDIVQLGTGQVTVAPASGVTINATPGTKLAAQYSTATLLKLATDTWLLVGSLAA